MKEFDIEWTEQSRNASESMPLGGGNVGCNVWVENGQIFVYMAQSGWFDENNSLLKAGRIRITLDPCPFTEDFSQKLTLKCGDITIRSKDFKAELWVDREWDTLHIEISDSVKHTVTAAYETWRFEDRVVEPISYELFQCTEMFFYPVKAIVFHKDQVRQEKEQLVFWHQNDNRDLSSEKEFKDQGIGHLYEQAYNPQRDSVFGGIVHLGENYKWKGIQRGVYADTPYLSYQYISNDPVKHSSICVTLHQSYEKRVENWIQKTQKRLAHSMRNKKEQKKKTEEWWREYFEKSWICLQENNEELWKIGRNYQLFRYMMGCCYDSFWPVKFNGGLFTFDPGLVGESEWRRDPLKYTPDYRLWGGGSHTIQNQRLLYWPLLKSGDFEMMPQHFEFFNRTLGTAKRRVKHHFGIEGAAYAEQVGTYGLCCGCNQEWGNKSGLPCVQIRYLFSNSLETILMILDYHAFTGANIGRYLDFIDSILKFYDGFYPENDRDGKMILYPANALESYHVVKNPVDAIAGLDCVLERLEHLELPEITAEQREFWKYLRRRIPPLPVREKQGRKILAYAETLSWRHNCEIPELYPVFPYNRFGLLKDDPEGLAMAQDTAELAPESEEQLSHVSWHPTGIQYARLGMKEEAVEFLKKKLGDGPFRFPAFWGPGHDWVPDHNWGGSGMIQLQEMLMQTDGSKIAILPCWPEGVDVSFKLYAPQNTVVECRYEAGEVTELKVSPKERKKDIRIMTGRSVNTQ